MPVAGHVLKTCKQLLKHAVKLPGFVEGSYSRPASNCANSTADRTPILVNTLAR